MMNKVKLGWIIVSLFFLISCEDEKHIFEYYGAGNIKSEYYVEKGKLNGSCIEYFFNGKVKSRSTYKVGLLEGKVRQYYESGKKKIECSYVNGKLNGEYIELYENGKIKQSWTYVDDTLNGIYKEFSIDGVLLNKGNYYSGSYTGLEKVYTKSRLTDVKYLLVDTIVFVYPVDFFKYQEIRFDSINVVIPSNWEYEIPSSGDVMLAQNSDCFACDSSILFSIERAKMKMPIGGRNELYDQLIYQVKAYYGNRAKVEWKSVTRDRLAFGFSYNSELDDEKRIFCTWVIHTYGSYMYLLTSRTIEEFHFYYVPLLYDIVDNIFMKR